MRVRYSDSKKFKKFQIAQAISTSDEKLLKATKLLYSVQTPYEKRIAETTLVNDRGVRHHTVRFFKEAIHNFHSESFDKNRLRKHVLHYVDQLFDLGFSFS